MILVSIAQNISPNWEGTTWEWDWSPITTYINWTRDLKKHYFFSFSLTTIRMNCFDVITFVAHICHFKIQKNIFKSMIVVYRHAKYNTFVEVLCVKISLWLTNDHN